jgi:hypothetical protein
MERGTVPGRAEQGDAGAGGATELGDGIVCEEKEARPTGART